MGANCCPKLQANCDELCRNGETGIPFETICAPNCDLFGTLYLRHVGSSRSIRTRSRKPVSPSTVPRLQDRGLGWPLGAELFPGPRNGRLLQQPTLSGDVCFPPVYFQSTSRIGHSILLEELRTLTHTRHENRFVAKCDSVGGYFLGGENPT